MTSNRNCERINEGDHARCPRGGRRASGNGLWYESKEPGLGSEFAAACRDAFAEIEQHPDRFAKLETNRTRRDYRRFLLKRFPYVVIYEIMTEEVVILAVAHGRRRPHYWRKRGSHASPPYRRKSNRARQGRKARPRIAADGAAREAVGRGFGVPRRLGSYSCAAVPGG